MQNFTLWKYCQKALQYGCFDMIKLFIDYGVMRINTEELLLRFNFEKIRFQSKYCQRNYRIFCLSWCVNIDARDYDGYTALSKLCKYESNLPIIEVLGATWANIQAVSKGKLRLMPADGCRRKGCTNILRFLIENGADPYIIDSNRWNFITLHSIEGNVSNQIYTSIFRWSIYNYKPENLKVSNVIV